MKRFKEGALHENEQIILRPFWHLFVFLKRVKGKETSAKKVALEGVNVDSSSQMYRVAESTFVARECSILSNERFGIESEKVIYRRSSEIKTRKFFFGEKF